MGTYTYTQVYSEPCEKPKVDLFAKLVNGIISLAILTKSSISDV